MIYNSGWKAYLDGSEETKIQQRPDATMQIDLKPNIKFVDLKYSPDSFQIGKLITFGTIILIGWIFLKQKLSKLV